MPTATLESLTCHEEAVQVKSYLKGVAMQLHPLAPWPEWPIFSLIVYLAHVWDMF